MSLFGALMETIRQNKEITAGETAVTASVAITTPYETIYSVHITHKKTTSPGLGAQLYTYRVVDNVVTIFAWKPTDLTLTTPIAATVATTVSYIIIGRRRQ